jgi:hypothetical protein
MAPKKAQKAKGSHARQQQQQQQQHKKPPAPDSCAEPVTQSEFLVTLKSPIAGGAAVPVGIKLTRAWLEKNNMPLDVNRIDLSWNGKPIAGFRLGEAVSALVRRGKDIRLATRIKIPTDPKKLTCGTIGALVETGESRKELAAVHVEVAHCDCSAVNSGFVLSVQSAKDGEFTVRSIVQRLLPAGTLKSIGGRLHGAATNSIDVDFANSVFFPEEVFLGFNFFVDGGLLDMAWNYGSDPALTLKASTYLSRAG